MNTDSVNSGKLLKQLHDAIERQANNALRESGLTMAQVLVLLLLNDMEGNSCSLKEMEKLLGVAQSTCAGIVNRLALKGLVDCYTDPSDKRMKLVRITDAGGKCCMDAAQNMNDIERLMFQGITPEEKNFFNSMLQKIYSNIK